MDIATPLNKYDLPTAASSVGYTKAQTVLLATPEYPLVLESGFALEPVLVEYETYGTLNANRSNAVLITHALSGDAHVAGWDSEWKETHRPWNSRKPGWWDAMIGPGKAIDTCRYFVICSNVLGSCFGTTGPASVNPKTNRPWGLDFPVVTVGDWVALQVRLIDFLGIDTLYAVVGGSLGGQQVIEWAMGYPARIKNAAVLATAPRLSAQGLAFNAVGRHSILNDPNFNGGQYYGGPKPDKGLAAARMMAHITYLSEAGMDIKFGRRRQNQRNREPGFGIEFQVESYLSHQGKSFVERFDANSYLYITRAMDYYDAAARWGAGSIEKAVERIQARVMVLTFSTDWLYAPKQGRELAEAMVRSGKQVSYLSIDSEFGHDAFLIETEAVGRALAAFFSRGSDEN